MQSMSEMNESDVEVQAEAQEMELSQLEKAADEAPVVKLVNLILTDAVKRGASDKMCIRDSAPSFRALPQNAPLYRLGESRR